MKELKEKIEQIPAKLRIAIFDACQSGAITRLKGAKVVRPFLVEQDLKSHGSIFITSSSGDESSQESDQLKGSFFTQNWLSGLRGAADASGDRRVSLMEAYQYAFQNTLIQTKSTEGGAQHPNAQFKMDVDGDIILTDLNSGTGGLLFKKDLTGDILVTDSKANVLGEFHKDPDQESFLALPPGNFRIFQRHGNRMRQCSVKIRGVETEPVEKDGFTSGFQFLGFAKGGSRQEEVPSSWRMSDWSFQFPLEIGIGFVSGGFYRSFIGQVGYQFLPHLDVVADYAIHQMNRTQSAFRGAGVNQDMRLGLQSGKFLSPNLEFLGMLFHGIHIQKENSGYFKSCPGSTNEISCREYVPGEDRYWHWAGGTGVELSIRLWVWSQLSAELNYGLEYSWLDKGFRATSLNFIPSFHF